MSCRRQPMHHRPTTLCHPWPEPSRAGVVIRAGSWPRINMPVRTCVVTRKRYDVADLVRLQIDAHGVLTVATGIAGRSAWVHPALSAVQKLQARPGMAKRSLRRLPRSAAGLVDRVRAHTLKELEPLLVAAWRSGTLREHKQQQHCHGEVVVAEGREHCPAGALVLPWTAAQLGDLLHRAELHTLVALPSRPTQRLLCRLRRWRCLGYPPTPLASAS